MTTSELARQLVISRQRVNKLGRLGKIQREPDGKWDVTKVQAALRRNRDSRSPIKSLGEWPSEGKTR